MPVASNIDDVIAFAATDIGEVAYGGVLSLLDQMRSWTSGMFAAAGIFTPAANDTAPGQRSVTAWYGEHLKAIEAIEGPAAGDAGVIGTSAVINAVTRAAYAVKYAAIDGGITGAQQTAVVTLYNTVWA